MLTQNASQSSLIMLFRTAYLGNFIPKLSHLRPTYTPNSANTPKFWLICKLPFCFFSVCREVQEQEFNLISQIFTQT